MASQVWFAARDVYVRAELLAEQGAHILLLHQKRHPLDVGHIVQRDHVIRVHIAHLGDFELDVVGLRDQPQTSVHVNLGLRALSRIIIENRVR